MKSDIDFDSPGKQVSALRLAYSSDRSAYGTIPIPIGVVSGGRGPTVLLMAGNHGDEYEGQLVLARLLREIEPRDISGRLIILPSANLPAALAGRRLSPLDNGNLNRCFPGDPAGGPTARIAYYIESALVPRCDAWLDLHSGGTSLDSLYCVNVLESRDADQQAVSRAMARAFGAPLIVIYDDIGGSATSLAAAQRHGVACINTEMGGAGRVSRRGLETCRRGVLNVLAHLGVLASPPKQDSAPAQVVRIAAHSYVYADDSGVFEPYFGLGDSINDGTIIGAIHSLLHPGRPPLEIPCRQAGTLCMSRPMAAVEAGDCVALVCPDANLGLATPRMEART